MTAWKGVFIERHEELLSEAMGNNEAIKHMLHVKSSSTEIST
jgi:hypothetical protein